MERYKPATQRQTNPNSIESFSEYQKKNEARVNVGLYFDERLKSVQQSESILSSFSRPVELKRTVGNFLSDANGELNYLSNTNANILTLASTIKYNIIIADLINTGDQFNMEISREIDENTGRPLGEICHEVERATIKWFISQKPNDKFFSELNKLLMCNNYEEMSRRSKVVDLSAFPNKLLNIPAIKTSKIDIEKIKKYIIFGKKLRLHRKEWEERLMNFKERISEMSKAESIIDRLESSASKIRREQDLIVANGRKLQPLENSKKNILKLATTIQYNDAVWTIQSLGVDSGMRYADGVNRVDAEKNILNNNNISTRTLSWLADHYDNESFINEISRIFELVEKTNSIRSIDEDWLAFDSELNIDASIFPDKLPNILVMRPIKFAVRK